MVRRYGVRRGIPGPPGFVPDLAAVTATVSKRAAGTVTITTDLKPNAPQTFSITLDHALPGDNFVALGGLAQQSLGSHATVSVLGAQVTSASTVDVTIQASSAANGITLTLAAVAFAL